MVRFTLFCNTTGYNMRVEFRDADRVGEVGDTVRETMGFGDFILRNGYSLLPPSEPVGDCISDGDTVEVIPDPEAFFR